MKNKLKTSVLLYYIGLFFTVFSANVTNSSYLFKDTGLNSIARYASLLFLLGSILVRRQWKIKSFVTVCCITFISVAVIVVSNDKPLILYILLVVAIGNLSPYEVIKKIAVLNLVFLVMIVGLSLTGFIPNDTYIHYTDVAYCLGYYYYNTCSYVVFFLTVVGYFLINGKLRRTYEALYIIGSIIVNFVVYKVCTVRLTFYCYLIFLVMSILYKNTKLFKNNAFYRIVATLMFPVASFLTIILSVNYKKIPIIAVLDNLLSARFNFNYMAFQRYSVSILGNFIQTHGEEWNENWQNLYFYIDSGYIDTLLGNGVIVFFLAIISYTLIARLAVRENNYKLFVWCFIICVFSVVNNVFLSTTMNPLLLFTSMALESEKANRQVHQLTEVKKVGLKNNV